MLDVIRSHSQSWVVKCIFALIVLVFVFWGVGSYNSSRSSVLATVNDEPISLQDFKQTYERGVQHLRQQQPQLGQDDFKKMQLKKQIFSQMVNRELLLQEARRFQLAVSVGELRTVIEGIRDFAGEDGKFNPEVYKNVLKANQLAPADFEREMRQGMLIEKLQQVLTLPATTSAEEVRHFFDFARSSVDMSYVEFAASKYEKKVVLAENAAKDVYESQKDKYTKPEQARFALLKLSPAELAPLFKVTPEEVATFYQANLEQFKQEEKVHARHILFQLEKDASEQEAAKVLAKAEQVRKKCSAKNFAKLAKKYSQGPTGSRGGDLGWFGRGQMVKPFEEAAFALKKGEVSQPVRTMFGYHLVYVEDKAGARTLALDEVKAKIAKNLQYEKATENLKKKLDEVVELLLTGSNLEDAAKKIGLHTYPTQLLSKGQAPAGLRLDAKGVAALDGLALNGTLKEPVILADGYLFARKTELVPATPIPFKDVKKEIEQGLRLTKSRELALQAARSLAENIKKGKLPVAAHVKQKKNISRQGFIPELGMNQKLTNELFAATAGKWLPEAYEIGSGVVVARLDKVNLPQEKTWEQEKELWQQSLAQNKKQDFFQAAVQRLRNEAEIKILNEHILTD